MSKSIMSLLQEDNINSDLAKELLTVIFFFNPSMIELIPADVYKRINDLAASSKKDYYIDNNKSLQEQNISEECKDLISILYYLYIADSSEKEELINAWSEKKDD